MTKTGSTVRWTVSTGASLVLVMVVALVAAPVVSAGPGDGGSDDPIAALVGGDGGFFGGGGGEGGGGTAAHGRAMSRGETDSYGLALRAGGEGEQTRGRLAFGHRGADGGEGFAGEITCLSVGDDGVVQVSGTTREGRGHRHDHGGDKGEEGGPGAGGGEGDEPQPAAFTNGGHGGRPDHGGDKEGKEGSEEGTEGEEQAASRDFAFTILTQSDPQQFSLPKLGEAGTLTPCGGGDATTVAVTRGGFDAHK
ncbi:MAG: hypothetical protein ACRDYV_19530 [Acidimicrobiia bacterium]